jgi:hypothetical protein
MSLSVHLTVLVQLQDAAQYHMVYCGLQQLQIPQLDTAAHPEGYMQNAAAA